MLNESVITPLNIKNSGEFEIQIRPSFLLLIYSVRHLSSSAVMFSLSIPRPMNTSFIILSP